MGCSLLSLSALLQSGSVYRLRHLPSRVFVPPLPFPFTLPHSLCWSLKASVLSELHVPLPAVSDTYPVARVPQTAPPPHLTSPHLTPSPPSHHKVHRLSRVSAVPALLRVRQAHPWVVPLLPRCS